MFELKVISKFAAAHQLRMVTEKCENLHGHNWKVEAFVTGAKLNDAGVLMDFGIIKKRLAEIMDLLDHKFLNEIEPFNTCNPSSEMISRYIAEELQARINDPSVAVSRICVWESDDACATYIAG
jgi:6-pyruvoyltetrahydropterin/6-carboxytetrahydropterin synthase